MGWILADPALGPQSGAAGRARRRAGVSGRFSLPRWVGPHYTAAMRRLRTDKVRQLCGIGALAGFLLVVISLAGDTTDEALLAYVLVGSVLVFLAGFYLGPRLISSLNRPAKKERPASADSRKPR